MKIPFSPPYIDDSVIAEVTDSLRSGWITTGPKVKALEAEIQQLTGTGPVLDHWRHHDVTLAGCETW